MRETDMERMVAILRAEVPRWPHDRLQVRAALRCRVPCVHPITCAALGTTPQDAITTTTHAYRPQQEVLTEALAAEWTRAQSAVLERTEGVESVSQAVQRVASNAPQVRGCGRGATVSSAIIVSRALEALPGLSRNAYFHMALSPP